MCKVTIDLISPTGVPVTLEVNHGDDQQTIIDMLARAEKIGVYFGAKGWTYATAESTGPSADELAQGPTFAGYPCSPTVDARGLPTWLIVNGKQAQRRESRAMFGTASNWSTVNTSRCCAFPRGKSHRQ